VETGLYLDDLALLLKPVWVVESKGKASIPYSYSRQNPAVFETCCLHLFFRIPFPDVTELAIVESID